MTVSDADLARAIIQALPLQRSDLVRADHLALTLLLSSVHAAPADGSLPSDAAPADGALPPDAAPADGSLPSDAAPAGLTVSEIARALGLHTRTVTELVNRLVRSGYVLRAAHPKDARRVLVRLTSKGLRERARSRSKTKTPA